MHRKPLFLAFLIFALAIFFRFWMLGGLPPGLYPDEAMNGSNALYALESGDFKVFYPENNGREGLFMNLTALSVYIFGNEPWAIRLVSAVFGSLTVLGMFFLGRELFRNEVIALMSSFFTAVSFWHINFSRIGFRAIMAPFFLVWGLYFLWLLFRNDLSERKKYIFSALGGFIFGLGAHSYIAYRVVPVLLLIPFWTLLKNKAGVKQTAVFLLLALIAFAPLGLYYLENPRDFLGRTSQVSIFSEANPAKSLFINSAKTLGSFWFVGDWNARHNFPGRPLLWWPVGILFAIGLGFGIHSAVRPSAPSNDGVSTPALFLFLWLFLGTLPTILSSEGLPHALRSIILLPAVMFFAGLGFWEVASRIKTARLSVFFLAIFLSAHIVVTYNDYFLRWANMPETKDAFSAGYAKIGRELRAESQETRKYVLVNADGVPVLAPDNPAGRPIPMPSQTIMFLTDTWPEHRRAEKNTFYVLPGDLDKITCLENCVIVPIEKTF